MKHKVNRFRQKYYIAGTPAGVFSKLVNMNIDGNVDDHVKIARIFKQNIDNKENIPKSDKD